MSRQKLMISWVEHAKFFITSGSGAWFLSSPKTYFLTQYLNCYSEWLHCQGKYLCHFRIFLPCHWDLLLKEFAVSKWRIYGKFLYIFRRHHVHSGSSLQECQQKHARLLHMAHWGEQGFPQNCHVVWSVNSTGTLSGEVTLIISILSSIMNEGQP